MRLFLLLFALLALLASPTTGPSPPNETSPGSTTPEPIGTTTGPNSSTNGTEESSLSGTTRGTESVPEPVPSVREIAPGSGPERANLSLCWDPYTVCRIGNACVDEKAKEGRHTNLTTLSHLKLKKASNDAAKTAKMLECNVGLVMREDPANANEYLLEYHTTTDYMHLPFLIEQHGTKRRIAVVNGTLTCRPACKISNRTRTANGNAFYWTSTIAFSPKSNRAQLDYCLKGKKYWHCFVGSRCLDGRSGTHDRIRYLNNTLLATLSPQRRNKLKSCDVIGALRWTTHLRKHNGANQRGYVLDYHTTPNNTHLKFRINKRNISVVNGKSSKPKLQCGEKYVGAPVIFDSKHNKLFWSGKIVVLAPKSNASGEAMDIEGQPQAKGEEEIQKEEGGSKIGMIFLGCAGGLVLFVVAAIIVIKVVQKRRETKNKRRLAAINAVVKQSANTGAHSREGLTGKATAKEVAPLIETPVSAVDPPEELSARLPDSDSAKLPDSERTSRRQTSEMTATGDKEE